MVGMVGMHRIAPPPGTSLKGSGMRIMCAGITPSAVLMMMTHHDQELDRSDTVSIHGWNLHAQYSSWGPGRE